MQRADPAIRFKQDDIAYYKSATGGEYIKVRIVKVIPDHPVYDYDVDPVHSPHSGAAKHKDLYNCSTIYDAVDELVTV